MKNNEATTLALEIADEAARSDVEVYCYETSADGHRWYDTASAPPEDVEWVGRALRYLDLRKLMIRHPDHPQLVRWERESAVEKN